LAFAPRSAIYDGQASARPIISPVISFSISTEQLLKTPSAIDSVDYSISLNDLKYRWEGSAFTEDRTGTEDGLLEYF